MTITSTELAALLGAWLWPFVRIAALVSSAPIIGTRAVPPRIRVLLALALSGLLVPVLPAAPLIEPLSPAGVLVTLQQVLIGLVLGLSLRLIFTAVEFAGQLLGQQMGLGFAAMVDPTSGNQVPVVSQLYMLLATLLFLSLNGHLLMVEALAESFHTVPVGIHGVTHEGIGVLLRWAGELFAQAMVMALPTITALLIVNVAYAILARAAPQLNIFAVGFPLTLMAGALLIYLTLASLPQHLRSLIDLALLAVRQILTSP